MSSRIVLGIILLVLTVANTNGNNIEYDISPYADEGLGRNLTIKILNSVVLSGVIGKNRDLADQVCDGNTCTIGNVKYTLDIGNPVEEILVTWETDDTSEVFKDCFDLSTFDWFGGPERYFQYWPIQKQVLDGNQPYIVQKTDNFAVAERYWLNSKGVYIFIDDKVPLFIDQNNEENGTLCLIAKAENPYIKRSRVFLQYRIVVKSDPKTAHLHAINNYLGKPKGHPNEKMVKEPIWTTWAKFKQSISDDIVLGFVNDIVNHGFTKGQIEIDEDWETCFGAHVFKQDKFANIQETVKTIKDFGFRVTLWINPFVNDDCEDYSTIGTEKGYFVKNENGNTTAIWWESEDAHQIDFTNPEAAEWFSTRIAVLKEDPGVDGFKFDAGETNYAIPPSLYENMDPEEVPNCLTIHYVKTCAEFGDLIEVRSAWRTQEYPMFIRMIDKDSVWGDDDGLATLIPTLLQMNMNGYSMVLPDMVGGNGYKAQPTAELIIRWTEANALMPALQLGFLPWDYESDAFDVTAILKKFIDLHEEYGDEIIKAMEASIKDGTPVNPPIWWVDPFDLIAHGIDDEFLLGENILVAPVIKEGELYRDIYLPRGLWKDANDGFIYEGPINIGNYPVPIDVLPFFIKQ